MRWTKGARSAGRDPVTAPVPHTGDALAAAIAEVSSRFDVRTIRYEPVPHHHDLPVLASDGGLCFPGTSLPLDADAFARHGVEVPVVQDGRRLGRLVVRLQEHAEARRADAVWLHLRASALAAALTANDSSGGSGDGPGGTAEMLHALTRPTL